MTIINYDELDLSKLKYHNPDKIRGSFISRVTYNDEPIYIKTPVLKNISGIVKTDTKAHLDLEFSQQTLDFYEFLCHFDETNINQIHLNSLEWFKKEFPLDVVDDFYISPLKHKNIPKLRLKIPLSKNKITCVIYDDNKQLLSDLTKNNEVICVLEFVGLRFLKQQVICEWIPTQIKTNDSNKIQTHHLNYLIEDDINVSDTTESISLENNDLHSNASNYENDTNKNESLTNDSNNLKLSADEESFIDNSEKLNQLSDTNELDTLTNDITLTEISGELELNTESEIESIKNELLKYKSLSESKTEELNKLKNKIKNCLE